MWWAWWMAVGRTWIISRYLQHYLRRPNISSDPERRRMDCVNADRVKDSGVFRNGGWTFFFKFVEVFQNFTKNIVCLNEKFAFGGIQIPYNSS